ncbi:glycosyltransferase [Paenibacillus elgii]|uniref:glycosyltransferase n=1 Tax=Paenibacillus elgii TaxID=189691 RepID=UPI00203E21F3|nr:glycosyltransferase [Paenibacillus elgii]MCM3270692.1 glycosyltransferase [Paenibacillus elgii]
MSLTVITPVLNEQTFLPLFLQSVTSFADEIIIVDGGSTDSSVDIIQSFAGKHNIRLFVKKQGMAYSDEWNESEVRNFMIDEARGDWIANIDADEIFDEGLNEILPVKMKQAAADVFLFPIVNFWRDLWTVRVNAPNDERWSNDIVRMWRNGKGIRYRDQKHHCTLRGEKGDIWTLPSERLNVPLYHCHYALGKKIKFNDNRRGDVNLIDNSGAPDWSFRHGEYEVRTVPFSGKHPRILYPYLRIQGETDVIERQVERL